MPEKRTIRMPINPAKGVGNVLGTLAGDAPSKTHRAFIASDKASGMTGTTVNLTMGSLDD
jgi:hypothetical protein